MAEPETSPTASEKFSRPRNTQPNCYAHFTITRPAWIIITYLPLESCHIVSVRLFVVGTAVEVFTNCFGQIFIGVPFVIGYADHTGRRHG